MAGLIMPLTMPLQEVFSHDCLDFIRWPQYFPNTVLLENKMFCLRRNFFRVIFISVCETKNFISQEDCIRKTSRPTNKVY